MLERERHLLFLSRFRGYRVFSFKCNLSLQGAVPPSLSLFLGRNPAASFSPTETERRCPTFSSSLGHAKPVDSEASFFFFRELRGSGVPVSSLLRVLTKENSLRPLTLPLFFYRIRYLFLFVSKESETSASVLALPPKPRMWKMFSPPGTLFRKGTFGSLRTSSWMVLIPPLRTSFSSPFPPPTSILLLRFSLPFLRRRRGTSRGRSPLSFPPFGTSENESQVFHLPFSFRRELRVSRVGFLPSPLFFCRSKPLFSTRARSVRSCFPPPSQSVATRGREGCGEERFLFFPLPPSIPQGGSSRSTLPAPLSFRAGEIQRHRMGSILLVSPCFAGGIEAVIANLFPFFFFYTHP